MAEEKRMEWDCGLPPVDTLPSEALDEEVSTWCILLASDLNAPLEPPALMRPWILARLVCAAALCAFQYHTMMPPRPCPPMQLGNSLSMGGTA